MILGLFLYKKLQDVFATRGSRMRGSCLFSCTVVDGQNPAPGGMYTNPAEVWDVDVLSLSH